MLLKTLKYSYSELHKMDKWGCNLKAWCRLGLPGLQVIFIALWMIVACGSNDAETGYCTEIHTKLYSIAYIADIT